MPRCLIAAIAFIALGTSNPSFSQSLRAGFAPHGPRLIPQSSGTTNRLQAISPVSSASCGQAVLPVHGPSPKTEEGPGSRM
jgi:hypothetical protein